MQLQLSFKNTVTAIFIAAFVLTTGAAVAQTIDDLVPDLTPSEIAEVQKGAGTYINGVTIFTGLDSISGGTFSFEQGEGRADTDLDILRVPFTYHFGDAKDKVRPFSKFVIGHFELRSPFYEFSDAAQELQNAFPDDLAGLPVGPDFRKDDATSLSLGGGFDIAVLDDLIITPQMNVIWTHVKRRYDYHNYLSALYGVKFDRDIFNTSIEAISYAPGAKVEYKIGSDDGYALRPALEYNFLSSYDLSGKGRYDDFSSDSGVMLTSLKGQIPLGTAAWECPMSLRPFVNRTDLYRAAYDSIGLHHFYEVGLQLAFDAEKRVDIVKSINLSGSYTFGDDFWGYRLGLSFDTL